MRGGGNTSYGMARGMNIMPPRVLDIALHNRLKPGVEASQAIPAGMRMGDSLPLVPPKAEGREPEAGEMPREYKEPPKGRILIYWGCGATVRGRPAARDRPGARQPGRFRRGVRGALYARIAVPASAPPTRSTRTKGTA